MSKLSHHYSTCPTVSVILLRKTAFAVFLFSSLAMAQGTLQPRRLVDTHTAGVLPRASFDFESRVYPASDPSFGTGLIMGIAVGVTDRLNIGISYGGEGIVGRTDRVRFNPYPGFLLKYRIFEETFSFPGFSIGFDYQGFGGIADTNYNDYNGYVYKSPGFFVTASKSYMMLSVIQVGFHGGMNFSLEEVHFVKWPNATAGLDIGFNEELAFVFEYDFGLNVRGRARPGEPVFYGRPQDGFLNAGVRWAFTPSFYIEFNCKDILENRHKTYSNYVGWSRELKLVYFSRF